MKVLCLLSFLFLMFTCSCVQSPESISSNGPEETLSPRSTTYHLYPNDKGRIDISPEEAARYQPGDTLYLRGAFLSIRFKGLRGSADRPIYITNYPGESLAVGDPQWTGGAYSTAFQLHECKHIVVGADEDRSMFVIAGPLTPQTGGYIGLSIQPFTDNVEVKFLTIRHCALGIYAKNDPEKDKPQTWHPNGQVENLSIHDVVIAHVHGEAMYIGHSWVNCGWDENGRLYSAGPDPDPAKGVTVRPIMWRNVKIFNNLVYDCGWDGIQVSQTDQLEIYNNEVYDFGLRKTGGQCMGILVGGNSSNTYTYNNYVHDGHGEMFQFHGADAGGSTHVVFNNLLVGGEGSGIGVYGLTDDVTILFHNNTVANCKRYALQANGRGKKPMVRLDKNLFVECRLERPGVENYFWVINGAEVEHLDNRLFLSAEDALVDPLRYYVPLPGSPVGDAGYRR